MEYDEDDDKGVVKISAVNSIILDYYKKFGRKRDLEQYFSLSTALGEVRDPTGTFWRSMKVHSDSSDSGGKKSESSQELCRISIKCSVPDPSSSQDERTKSKSEPVSPPIIIEDFTEGVSRATRCVYDESEKSSDEHSQKSLDVLLDTSMNKLLSPSSSVTSQRKLEWDSLADVGYANETDRKASASNLSTLEKLALQQQYSNNDTRQELGLPTAHSTPLDENQTTSKGKKGVGKRTAKIYKGDVETVELNVNQNPDNKLSQAINVHLTKHISFNVDKSGELRIENIKKDIVVSPQKTSKDGENISQVKVDKEIQTKLMKSKENSNGKDTVCSQKIPILMSVNTLRKKTRRRKLRLAQRKAKNKKSLPSKKESVQAHEKSGDQLSEAESFEYMPGHIYNQNHLKLNQSVPNKVISNKSSFESSGVTTTDSSNGSKHSFTKDLEKSIELLKDALQQRYDDNLKNKLVKEIIQKIVKSKYRDDDSTTDFLSGLSFDSKKLGLEQSNTTSTHTSGDGNMTIERKKLGKPKKSILRMDTFNANAIASTSQSAPNLPIATNSDKPITNSKPMKRLTSSNTDSDISSKEKNSNDSIFAKTSSEVLYSKYLDAVRREEAYKKHLKDKELLLKCKLASSDSAFKIPKKPDNKINSRLQDLMTDLIRNNYDDGSGDASKLEGGSDTKLNYKKSNVKVQRSHSVYTLSSCNSDSLNKKADFKKRLQDDIKDLSKPGPSRENNHYCCCPHHFANNKCGVTDSSVQVNIKELDPSNENQNTVKKCLKCETRFSQKMAEVFSDQVTNDIKYVCLCSEKGLSQDLCENFLVYKCSRVNNQDLQPGKAQEVQSDTDNLQSKSNCMYTHINKKSPESDPCKNDDPNQKLFNKENMNSVNKQFKMVSKSSQTNVLFNICEKPSDRSVSSSISDVKKDLISPNFGTECTNSKNLIHEATRCIQTEISINPQLSDPSLPDINIINDAESVKVISDLERNVSKRKCAVDICNYEDKRIMSNKNNKKSASPRKNVDSVNKKEIQNLINENLFTDNINLDSNDINNSIVTNNFTIPIEGTNMKLMVTIGSNDHRTSGLFNINSLEAKKDIKEKSDYSQESTSAGEESCKSVQYQKHMNKIPFTNANNQQYLDNNSNNSTSNKPKCHYQQLNKPSCDNINALKLNTYTINENKPNISTNNLEVSVQTNSFPKTDFKTKEIHKISDNEPKIASETYPQQLPLFFDIEDTKNKQNTIEIPKEIKTRNKETQSNILQTTLHTEQTVQTLHNTQIDKQYTSPRCGNCGVHAETNTLSNKSNILSNQLSPEIQSIYNLEIDAESTDSKNSNENNKPHEPVIKKRNEPACGTSKDPILNIIKDITKKYSKDDMEKQKRKKCFKEIVTVLNYLLDTDDSTDPDQLKVTCDCTDNKFRTEEPIPMISESSQTVNKVDKGIQMSVKESKNKLCYTDSSDILTSDLPRTSSDSATCKVLNKIKKECERYHLKRCRNNGQKCDASSTTSANCNQCNKIHHCSCRLHKCKSHKAQKSNKTKSNEMNKKSVAYNLIIQTSESMISEETICGNNRQPLKNIIVKIPSRGNMGFVPFKELESKIEKKMSECSPRCNKSQKSKNCLNDIDISSTEECYKNIPECTVREYLEMNRPDFIEKCAERQDCLKVINESRDPCSSPRMKMVVVHTPNCMGSVASCNMYCGGVVPMTYNPCLKTFQNDVTRIANERAVKQVLLSAQVDRQSPLTELDIQQLRQLARDIGIDQTHNKRAPKFLSERDMKKHSEKIYKSLSEVRQKKEDLRKENIKKTNLLMANIFKKNLQKKTLRGLVNLSNYSKLVKI